ncbi:hypothetical protein ETAA8_38690 [Anatilimnocola aggregata]|uniref:Uncharacterized protein n=1 Tax=Anatilimnocola aggregata TaxID=2528021 RepID=A0A517YEU7_9BACT|nr:BBP7 family outer membrane beta-barrel protein [Anatilimnocola aggregata]QDU28764.1 hypothetical protein ETAA8_38690 [Anatilimnocola aggregata]
MHAAWNVRRFLLPMAGAVCWTSLSLAAELLSPPKPPPDNDGLELAQSSRVGPRPVLIEAADEQEPIVLQPAEQPTVSPAEPLALQPADPQPIIEQPLVDYPEYLPPPIMYAPACDSVVMPSCSTPLYETTPACEDSCFCSCVPTWTFRAEALIWDRTGGANVPLVVAPVAVSTADLDSGWRAGPRLTAIRHGIFGSCWDAEVSYFGIDGWNGTLALADINDLQTTPVLLFPGVTPGTLNYTSDLHSFEFNLRRPHNDWVTWLVGFRAVQVNELLAVDLGGAGQQSFDTMNHLYGVQAGLDLRVVDRGTWYVNAVGKAGIYGNSANLNARSAGIAGSLPLINSTGNQTAFVGEVGVTAGYRLTERLSLLAGYSVLWVDGVALAPDQLAGTNVTTGASVLDANGSLVYHGVNLGLEYGW